MTEKIIQICSDNDIGERTLYALTSNGRIFGTVPKEKGQPMKWHEINLPELSKVHP